LARFAKYSGLLAEQLPTSVAHQIPTHIEWSEALGFLAGRFSFTSYATGEVLVVERALTPLAVEGISFTVEGPATYAEAIPAFRTPPAHQVQ
jgi:hypothetical protein